MTRRDGSGRSAARSSTPSPRNTCAGRRSPALAADAGFLPARKPEHHPALISAFGLCDEPEPGVITAPRDVISVHLTLLKPDGSGKAKVEKPKLVIGSPGGRPIVDRARQ